MGKRIARVWRMCVYVSVMDDCNVKKMERDKYGE